MKPVVIKTPNIYYLFGGINMCQKELGERIRNLRKEKGISQEKFALLIGMDRTHLASVEAGNRNISLKNIVKIASGFNISLSELFRGIGEGS